MADISLPDDVFENMRHAQEAAAEMETSVEKFNDNVDKKFKEKDANEKNKISDDVNSILTTKEKTRYKNIGIAFFSGAKDSIVAVFKQIDKDRSKSLLKKATGAVSNVVASIKEQAEEHKTTSKILAAVALIGGIYFLFKNWFDEKIPPIWEKIKEACENIPAVISALGDTIGKIFDGSGIADSISTFFKDSFAEIKGFLQRMLDFFKDIFKNEDNSEGVMLDSKGKILNKDKYVELETTYRLDDYLFGNVWETKEKGIVEIPKNFISDTQEKLKQLLESASSEERDFYIKYLKGQINATSSEEIKLANDINGLIREASENFADAATAKLIENRSWWEDFTGQCYSVSVNDGANREILSDMIRTSFTDFVNREETFNKQNQDEQKVMETKLNEETIENTNADKIVDVAVVTNLNQFIKDFFTGDKEGTFKHFSSTAIATIGAELSNINSTVKTELTNISNLVKEKLTSLINYEKLDRLIDNLIKTQWLLRGLQGTITTEFDTLYDDLTNYSEQKVKNDLKNFITEKFNNTFNGNNTQIFADIIKEEQAQTASLKEQSQILEDTKKILNAIYQTEGAKPQALPIIVAPSQNEEVPTSSVPFGTQANAGIYYSSGMSPYSMA